MTECWGVALEGHPFDIAEAKRCFNHTELQSVRIGTLDLPSGNCLPALFAEIFDELTEPSKVHHEAERIVALLNGILFVSDQNREPLRIISVHSYIRDGWSGGVSFLTARAKSRSRATASLSGGTAQSPTEAPEVRWMELARTEAEVSDVLLFLRDPEPDWFDLYKASELLESAKQQPWWPKSKFSDLTGTAQFGRHARGAHEKMTQRMALEEAYTLIAELARQWLNWWITDEARARSFISERAT